MDDVAREVSMSKKTIYQYFENKDQLIREVAKAELSNEAREFQEIEAAAKDAIHELLMVTQCLRRHIFNMNPALLFDLQKYHAEAWNEYLAFKEEFIRGHIRRNIENGIREGYFRMDLDAEVLSILRVEEVQLVFNPKIFPTEKFDFASVQIQILNHFIHGLLTEKGREKYDQYLKEEPIENLSITANL